MKIGARPFCMSYQLTRWLRSWRHALALPFPRYFSHSYFGSLTHRLRTAIDPEWMSQNRREDRMCDDWQSILNHAAPRETGRRAHPRACAQAVIVLPTRQKFAPGCSRTRGQTLFSIPQCRKLSPTGRRSVPTPNGWGSRRQPWPRNGFRRSA